MMHIKEMLELGLPPPAGCVRSALHEPMPTPRSAQVYWSVAVQVQLFLLYPLILLALRRMWVDAWGGRPVLPAALQRQAGVVSTVRGPPCHCPAAPSLAAPAQEP